MKIVLTLGHSKLKNGNLTSANGNVNEYLYNKELIDLVAKYIKQLGHTCDVVKCPEGVFTAAKEEAAYKLNKVNNKGYGLVVEFHLNAAADTSAHGTEVLYASSAGKAYAEVVLSKMETLFESRGVKQRNDLYILTKTQPTAILIESFFCTNKSDCTIANDKKRIAKLIAEGVTGQTLERDEDMKIESINLSINGSIKEISSVNIDGNNFVKLRDVCGILGIEVGYDAVKKMPIIKK